MGPLQRKLRVGMQTESRTLSAPFLVAVGAVATLLAGLALLFYMAATASRPYALESEAQARTMSVWMTDYEWLEHDHANHDHSEDAGETNSALPSDLFTDAVEEATEGFSMPASMMPGTPPEGSLRLQVSLDLYNRAGGTQEIDPADFHLENDRGDTWPTMIGGNFRPVELDYLQAYSTIAAFDIEFDDITSTMHLIWNVDGDEKKFIISDEDAADILAGAHDH